MRTLIIPDIHCMYAEAEAIISSVKHDKVILLGDYFDRYDNDPTLTTKVAKWLKESLKKENRVHLLGNHELWYCSGNDEVICSGNTQTKYQSIRQVGIDWNKFVLHAWVGGWLVTHAGLTAKYYIKYGLEKPISEFIEQESADAKKSLLSGKTHRLFSVSHLRGGMSDVAGTLWCDIREFRAIRNLNQIFGHSHSDLPEKIVLTNPNYDGSQDKKWEYDSINWCIDCAGWYALYDGKNMTVHDSMKGVPS